MLIKFGALVSFNMLNTPTFKMSFFIKVSKRHAQVENTLFSNGKL